MDKSLSGKQIATQLKVISEILSTIQTFKNIYII